MLDIWCDNVLWIYGSFGYLYRIWKYEVKGLKVMEVWKRLVEKEVIGNRREVREGGGGEGL